MTARITRDIECVFLDHHHDAPSIYPSLHRLTADTLIEADLIRPSTMCLDVPEINHLPEGGDCFELPNGDRYLRIPSDAWVVVNPDNLFCCPACSNVRVIPDGVHAFESITCLACKIRRAAIHWKPAARKQPL